MIAIASRRLIAFVGVLVGVSIITFGVVRLIPGDPATNLLGSAATDEDIARIRSELHLDDPLAIQYVVWVGNVLQGDLGDSAVTRQPVGRQVVNAFGNSVILATFSIVLALSLGLVMGTIAAVNRGRWIDRATTALAVTGTSVPSYWLGLVMIYVFAVDLGWFPTGGRTTLDDGSLVDQFRHLVLPGTTLALAATGTIARVTRTSLLEVLDQDYIRTARAKGVSETHVTIGHALRNALIPVVNVAGLQIGFLLGSAIVIEQVFAWPGAGRLVYNSIAQRDYPVLQGSVLFIATAFVLVNLVVDLLSTYLDPRVRFA